MTAEGPDGSGPLSAVADGIRWSADQGVKVINMSLGVSGNPRLFRALGDAVAYADSLGVLQVAASGNDGRKGVHYPAAYPEVIAVGATTYNEELAYYSNYGNGQELVAPGGTDREDLNGDGYPDMVLQNTFDLETGNLCEFSYWFMMGTSMAVPHVTGTAALLFAAGATDKDQVRLILQETADDLGPSGYDATFGHGIINAAAALAALVDHDDPPVVQITAPQDGAIVKGTVTLTADATDDKGVAKVEFLVDAASIGVDIDGSDGWRVDWDTTLAPVGTHNVTADATDPAGRSASDTIEVTVDQTASATMHVADLDGVAKSERSLWRAEVTVTVHDGSSAAVAGAQVTIDWSGGYSGTASATTGNEGQCTFSTGTMAKRGGPVTLTVVDISDPGYTYDAAANHDPDDDGSDGTTISVSK